MIKNINDWYDQHKKKNGCSYDMHEGLMDDLSTAVDDYFRRRPSQPEKGGHTKSQRRKRSLLAAHNDASEALPGMLNGQIVHSRYSDQSHAAASHGGHNKSSDRIWVTPGAVSHTMTCLDTEYKQAAEVGRRSGTMINHRFSVGQRVQVLHGTRWLKGIVLKCHSDPSYNVRYDAPDGTEGGGFVDRHVPGKNMKAFHDDGDGALVSIGGFVAPRIAKRRRALQHRRVIVAMRFVGKLIVLLRDVRQKAWQLEMQRQAEAEAAAAEEEEEAAAAAAEAVEARLKRESVRREFAAAAKAAAKAAKIAARESDAAGGDDNKKQQQHEFMQRGGQHPAAPDKIPQRYANGTAVLAELRGKKWRTCIVDAFDPVTGLYTVWDKERKLHKGVHVRRLQEGEGEDSDDDNSESSSRRRKNNKNNKNNKTDKAGSPTRGSRDDNSSGSSSNSNTGNNNSTGDGGHGDDGTEQEQQQQPASPQLRSPSTTTPKRSKQRHKKKSKHKANNAEKSAKQGNVAADSAGKAEQVRRRGIRAIATAVHLLMLLLLLLSRCCSSCSPAAAATATVVAATAAVAAAAAAWLLLLLTLCCCSFGHDVVPLNVVLNVGVRRTQR